MGTVATLGVCAEFCPHFGICIVVPTSGAVTRGWSLSSSSMLGGFHI